MYVCMYKREIKKYETLQRPSSRLHERYASIAYQSLLRARDTSTLTWRASKDSPDHCCSCSWCSDRNSRFVRQRFWRKKTRIGSVEFRLTAADSLTVWKWSASDFSAAKTPSFPCRQRKVYETKEREREKH